MRATGSQILCGCYMFQVHKVELPFLSYSVSVISVLSVTGKDYQPSKVNIGRRQWHPTPVLLPRKAHGRRSLLGCSPWGR